MPADWNEVICIDDWKPDDSAYEKGYYPEGTRDKAVYSPDDVGNLPLRPRWRYLLKKSNSRAPWQFWMEIIAYRIGQVMDVPVPPAHVGLHNHDEPDPPPYGALIEWFYAEEKGEGYVEGARLIRPLVPDFDDKKGNPHPLLTILKLPCFVDVPNPEANRTILIAYWASILTFDTVIGNVDRHPENWGIVVPSDSKGIAPARPSPAFDNGTALSYEQPEEHFPRFDDDQYARLYLTRPRWAKHHMQWSLDEAGNLNFFQFMQKFAREFPHAKDSILNKLQFNESDLRARLEGLLSIPVPDEWRLTPRRLDFTLGLVMKRAELLKRAMETI
jgi:hypothetical protein